jgi:hypothetical protein
MPGQPYQVGREPASADRHLKADKPRITDEFQGRRPRGWGLDHSRPTPGHRTTRRTGAGWRGADCMFYGGSPG